MSILRSLLRHPAIYNTGQTLLGFAGVRRKVINQYLALEPGTKLLDIGCGPGHILRYLPKGIVYDGFDIDEDYIAYAKETYGERANFHCRLFDRSTAEEFAGADVVMFNGVLHHMTDEEVVLGLESAGLALREGGMVLTLDGCYREGQNRIAKSLLDNDRGEYVRTRPAYESLMERVFTAPQIHIRDDLSAIPYTFIVMTATKAAD